MWSRLIVAVGLAAALSFPSFSHDRITTAITWNREISRIVNERCIVCHREGGRAFSLMTYGDARPWAVAMKEEVLSRRMPPWGAVKGFGEFRNDQALTGEQLELIVDWVEGGAPEGDPADLPVDVKIPEPPAIDNAGALNVSGELALTNSFTLDGLFVQRLDPGAPSFQITAELPDGSIVPLLWLYQYKPEFGHPFLLKEPLELPRGTVIRGIPSGARISLLPRSN